MSKEKAPPESVPLYVPNQPDFGIEGAFGAWNEIGFEPRIIVRLPFFIGYCQIAEQPNCMWSVTNIVSEAGIASPRHWSVGKVFNEPTEFVVKCAMRPGAPNLLGAKAISAIVSDRGCVVSFKASENASTTKSTLQISLGFLFNNAPRKKPVAMGDWIVLQ